MNFFKGGFKSTSWFYFEEKSLRFLDRRKFSANLPIKLLNETPGGNPINEI
jgi:hypothetical protein